MGTVKTIPIFLFLNIAEQSVAFCMAAMDFNHFVYDLMLLQARDLDLRI